MIQNTYLPTVYNYACSGVELRSLPVSHVIIDSLSVCTKLSSSSEHKLSITLCPQRAARDESSTSVFLQHQTELSAASTSWSMHCIFFLFVCLFVCFLNPEFKETWYWDSSNVTEMVMSGVKCTGTEMSLSQCQHHKTVSCQKSAAKFSAGVICSDSEWRPQMFQTNCSGCWQL